MAPSPPHVLQMAGGDGATGACASWWWMLGLGGCASPGSSLYDNSLLAWAIRSTFSSLGLGCNAGVLIAVIIAGR